MYNYTIKYRTFNQLLSDISVDFIQYDLNNYIEPQQLIKVAQRVTYDLGLRIMMTHEAVLDVTKGRVRLPNDFFVLNYAMVCDDVTITSPVIQGTNIQEIPFSPVYQQTSAIISPCTDGNINCQVCGILCSACTCQKNPAACPDPIGGAYCNKPKVILGCKGESFELVQILKTETRSFRRVWPLRILENAQSITCDCPNLYIKSADQAWIKDNFLFTTLQTAHIYISYQGQLEDDNGNLLVPDHPQLNEYYEYALKKRILENLIMNDENISQAKIQLIEQGYRVARINALSLVNTPNYSEMKEMWWQNRRAQYGKYYDQFKSYNWNNNNSINYR